MNILSSWGFPFLFFYISETPRGNARYLGSYQFFDVSVVLGGGSNVARDSFPNFLSLEVSARDAEVLLPTNILGSIRFCCRFSDIHPLICWRFSSGSCLSQKVPCFLGAPKSSEGLLHACEQFPGEYYPCLLIL